MNPALGAARGGNCALAGTPDARARGEPESSSVTRQQDPGLTCTKALSEFTSHQQKMSKLQTAINKLIAVSDDISERDKLRLAPLLFQLRISYGPEIRS